MREADHYEKLEGDVVHCLLCPQDCRIRPGKVGFCRVRRNQDGVLVAVKYGRVASYAMDPVEKKPLYHFHPGTYVFSLGAYGCNLRCRHCQNWELSQGDGEDVPFPPERAVETAAAWSDPQRPCIGLAYTYSEPLVWFEYVLDTARLARERGLKNVLVTNGYVREEPLKDLLPYVDAMNVDVKSFSTEFYREVCSGRLEPVLRTVETAHAAGCHVEVTCLLIPGLNDGDEEVERLCEWLAGISPEIPLHLSRYFPNWKMTRPETPVQTLRRAREIAARHLSYVYIGNAWEVDAGDTACPSCGAVLVSRRGFSARRMELEGGKCRRCGRGVNIRDR
ncbi:MAG TPA: AmmeMemoRadiSam system radical SAM enzyme [Clostridiales bacterium]|nr:AmmeMemoRadiSam system radical SAM enzyme [Clostridiales bacterium]